MRTPSITLTTVICQCKVREEYLGRNRWQNRVNHGESTVLNDMLYMISISSKAVALAAFSTSLGTGMVSHRECFGQMCVIARTLSSSFISSAVAYHTLYIWEHWLSFIKAHQLLLALRNTSRLERFIAPQTLRTQFVVSTKE